MKIRTRLLLSTFALSIASGVFAAEQTSSDYQYNGITYMSMQADNGDWMDSVWVLEVEDTSNNLFDLVVSPNSKRISIKALTEIDMQEWVAVWNRKLQALDINSGLEQAQYAKSFGKIVRHLPEKLNLNDQFAIEIHQDDKIIVSINGEEVAALEGKNQFSFWMSAWLSAPKAGIYADGSMLAKGQIESYLVQLLEDESAALDPSMLSAAY